MLQRIFNSLFLENLHKLKELCYLNLALNNITKIENLERCESLSKLDLTVNFVSNPLDLESLRGNVMLKELFLVGNPITQVEGYREFAIITLPQLKVLDGKEIDKSERIKAAQIYNTIHTRLIKERQIHENDTKSKNNDNTNPGILMEASAESQ
ncbi:Protein tilB [Physocladia obscura]|uniref:Protein tilB n=1 Tax=Physocladia obscura TaxID=109957 RepID=A0AAD5T8W7_9FUNG|nr:Protein tilB [Physocladia obscura]